MRHLRLWLAGGVLLLVALAAIGILQRTATRAALATRTADDSAPVVSLTTPRAGPKTRELTLPGDVHAWFQAPLFGQVTGYVQMWFKDYGAPVQKGELLALIDTPGLDEEVAQAKAELEVTEANEQLAAVTATRWKKLSGTEAVAQQDVDVKVATERAEKAKVDAAQSNLRRLEAQEGFKRIVAPFTGIVTARHTDVGDYVNAGGGDAGSAGGGQRQELFSVADIHKLRIFVSVPQDYSAFLSHGVTATLSLPQYPGRRFPAEFLTSAQAVNTESRTVLTELVHDNRDHSLMPGAFVEVHFILPTDPGLLIVPEQSLLFRPAGMQVATVRNGRVHLQDVRLGLNLGASVQVLAGLQPGERIIANPSLGLLEGEAVRVVHAPSQDTNLVADTPARGADPAPEQNAGN